jgi:hypothetical protein
VEEGVTALTQSHVAMTLLSLFIPQEDAEAIIGDLEEERASRAFGSRWYWSQIARSIPAVMWLTICRGGWVGTCGIAAAACAVQIAVEVTTGFAIYQFTPIDAMWPSVVAIVVTLTSLALVSYKASRIRRGAAIVLAGVAVCAVAVQLTLAAQAGPDLRSGTVIALIVVPGTILFAGSVSSRVRTP